MLNVVIYDNNKGKSMNLFCIYKCLLNKCLRRTKNYMKLSEL